MSERVQVAAFDDVARDDDLAQREAEAVVRLLNDGETAVVLAEWLAEKKDIRPVENERRVYRGSVLDETEQAWRVAAGDGTDWIPKSQSVVYERAAGVGEIETPTATLGEFAGGGSA